MPDILRLDDSRATRFALRLKRDATGNLLLSGTVCRGAPKELNQRLPGTSPGGGQSRT